MDDKNSYLPALLKIFLLGKFQIKLNDLHIEERHWQRRASGHLVKLLALHPQHQLHREQIIDLLWSHQDLEAAVNKLNKAIYVARRTLEPNLVKASDSSFIITQKQQILLRSPGSLYIDVEEFESLAAKAIATANLETCEAALKLYRGNLLIEDIYEDWLAVRRENLNLLFRKLMTKTAEIHAAKENQRKSIELLKKLVIEDPTDEYVHQRLMRLYAETGSKYQALKQFEFCRKALAENGIELESETLELKNQIQIGNFRNNKSAVNGKKNIELSLLSLSRVRQITFQPGVIQSTKFLPDGQDILYSAAWEGNEFELYKTNLKTLESNTVNLKNTGIFAVSPSGEKALASNRSFYYGYTSIAALVRQDAAGNLKEITKNVQWADYYPVQGDFDSDDSKSFAVVRELKGKNRLEYPIGNVLYETGGWISHPRFSPDGKHIAFIDHPIPADDGGAIAVVTLAGQKTILSEGWLSAQGLVWTPGGEEIWFTATKEGNARAVYAVKLTHNSERLIYKGIGSLTLHDLSVHNAALVTVDKTRIRILAKGKDQDKECDLSYQDWSLVRDISADGQTILFTEAGEGSGALYSVYIRQRVRSTPRCLGQGSAIALSPDGKFALTRLLTTPQQLALLPVSDGDVKLLKTFKSDLHIYQPWGGWFPDGSKIFFIANESNAGSRLYVQKINDEPVCLTPEIEGVELSSPHSISPDGKFITIIYLNRTCLLSTADGTFRQLPNLEQNYLPIGWSTDGKYLFIKERGKIPAAVYRYELHTGKKDFWFELMPKDTTGVHEILRVLMTPDGKSYAYSYTRDLSDLFLIEGL